MHILVAIENIQSQAPAKEPSKRPTVGFDFVRTVNHDDAENAIYDAFNEGYARAMWEVDQQLQPVAKRVEGMEAELARMTTWLNGEVTWENPDGPTAA
ncbi:MAG TPA: hypothetical protein VLZ84_07140 [Asticcacaulis sp.]|nr:hypothetical protein [Asticcacaulis sp.]